MPIHLPTILIIAGLILFFGLLIFSLIRDKKKGKSSCCGGCAGCAMAGKCHPERMPAQESASDNSRDATDPDTHTS